MEESPDTYTDGIPMEEGDRVEILDMPEDSPLYPNYGRYHERLVGKIGIIAFLDGDGEPRIELDSGSRERYYLHRDGLRLISRADGSHPSTTTSIDQTNPLCPTCRTHGEWVALAVKCPKCWKVLG